MTKKKTILLSAFALTVSACTAWGGVKLFSTNAAVDANAVAELKTAFTEFCANEDANLSTYVNSIYAGEPLDGYNPITVQRFLQTEVSGTTYQNKLAALGIKATNGNGADVLTDEGVEVVLDIFGVEKSVLLQNGSSVGGINNEKITGDFKTTSANGVAVGGATVNAAEGDFSVVVMGDQQTAVEYHSSYVAATYDYLVANKDAMNLKAFINVGDIVDDVDFISWRQPTGNSRNDVIYNPGRLGNWKMQLEFAQAQSNKLIAAGVPTVMTMGNHDYEDMAESYRLKNGFNDYFPLADYSSQSWFGGSLYQDIEASYYTFTGRNADDKYMVVSLGCYPTEEMLAWANQVVAAKPDYKVIVSTHSYLYGETSATNDYKDNDLTADGMRMWDTFVSQHSNVVMVVCGHECSKRGEVVKRVDFGKHGNAVTQFLIDPQAEEFGGAGIFSQFIFRADGTIDFVYYSPFCNDEYGRGYFLDENQFSYTSNPTALNPNMSNKTSVGDTIEATEYQVNYLSRKEVPEEVDSYYNVKRTTRGLTVGGGDTYGYAVHKLYAGDYKRFNQMAIAAQGDFLGADGAYQIDFSTDGENYVYGMYNNAETGYLNRPFVLDRKVLGAEYLYVRLTLKNVRIAKLDFFGASVKTVYEGEQFENTYTFSNSVAPYNNPTELNTTDYNATYSYFACLSNNVLGMGATGVRSSKSNIVYRFDAGDTERYITQIGLRATMVSTNLHAKSEEYTYGTDYTFGDSAFQQSGEDMLAYAYLSVDGTNWTQVKSLKNTATTHTVSNYKLDTFEVGSADVASYFASDGAGYQASTVWVKVEYLGAGDSFAPCGIKDITLTGAYNRAIDASPALELDGGKVYGNYELPVKDGYAFDGWRLNSVSGAKVNYADYATQNVSLYAAWKRIYRVTYVLCGGENSAQNKRYLTAGETLTLQAPTKTGSRFIGWYTAEGERVTVLEGTKNTVLYAIWHDEEAFAFSKQSYGVVQGKTLSLGLNTAQIPNYDESLLSVRVTDAEVLSGSLFTWSALKEGTVTVTADYNDGELTATAQVNVYASVEPSELTAFSENAVVVQGRSYTSGSALVFDHVNSGLEYWFYGTESKVSFSVPSSYANNDLYVCVYVDDGATGRFFPLNQYGENVTYTVVSGLTEGLHKVVLLKATEQNLWTAGNRQMTVNALVQDENCTIVKQRSSADRLKIDFYGDSITCGLSNLGAATNYATSEENGTLSYAAITGRNLNALTSCMSYSGITIACEHNLGATTTASIWNQYSSINREEYTVSQDTDFVVINLGTNDASAYYADKTTASEILSAAKALLTEMRAAYGSDTKFIWAYGMMGEDATVATQLQAAIAELGGADSGYYYLSLTANATDGAGGHPLVAGHEIAASVLTEYLQGLLA